MVRPSLTDILQRIEPRTLEEAADVAAAIELSRTGEPWSRSSPAHITGSALVVHPPSRRLLLRWHRRQQAWLQVGGHGDPGEHDPFEVAMREASEETGLTDLRPWPGPEPVIVHLVTVPVPAAGGEPAHEHVDVRYVLATDDPDGATAEAEHAPLRWVSHEEAWALTSTDNLRETLVRIGDLFEHPL